MKGAICREGGGHEGRETQYHGRLSDISTVYWNGRLSDGRTQELMLARLPILRVSE